jgi:hypothetical protein
MQIGGKGFTYRPETTVKRFCPTKLNKIFQIKRPITRYLSWSSLFWSFRGLAYFFLSVITSDHITDNVSISIAS